MNTNELWQAVLGELELQISKANFTTWFRNTFIASFEEKNIADDAVAAELIARGGKRQVPYLIDDERNIEMYESADIDKYLRVQYPKH